MEIPERGSDTGQIDPRPQGAKTSWDWFLTVSQERRRFSWTND